jgi:competence protein ComEA
VSSLQDQSSQSYVQRLDRLFPLLPHDDALDGASDERTCPPVSLAQGTPDQPVAEVTSAGGRASLRYINWSSLKDFGLNHLKVLAGLALVAAVATTWLLLRAQQWQTPAAVPTASWSAAPVVTAPTAEASIADWRVHVIGAVAQPGVVSLLPGSRVEDAIAAAGGLTAQADCADLNLAAELADGDQVIIGQVGAAAGEVRHGLTATGGGASAGGDGASLALVDLNQASAEQLEALPGVGPVTASAIIAWRDQLGPFSAISQLQEVDGIGPKTFARLEPYVTI